MKVDGKIARCSRCGRSDAIEQRSSGPVVDAPLPYCTRCERYLVTDDDACGADEEWVGRQAHVVAQRARKRWGAGWPYLSEHLREAEIAYEVVGLLLGQEVGSNAAQQVRLIQAVAREAFALVRG